MARQQVIECDRCGAKADEEAANKADWGRAFAATLGGDDRVGTSERAVDLCGACLKLLVKWAKGAKP